MEKIVGNEVLKKISKAKLNLFTHKNTIFYSSLLASLKLKLSDTIPTAATNGVDLIVNPDYVSKLEINELIGLLLHETMHVCLQHVDRRNSANLDPTLYNIAGDFVINNDLDTRGYVLPAGGLIDHKYDGWSTRQVYDDLEQNKPNVKLPMEDVIFSSPKGVSEEAHREKSISNVIKAATQARLQNDIGSIPGHVLRLVDELTNPKLPWNHILQNYMSHYDKSNYTWRKPNRRHWPDLYLPSTYNEALNQITVGIDVSGSINQDDLNAFMSEIRYIHEVMKPVKLRLMSFDTMVHQDLEFTEWDNIRDVKLTGGGGTYIGPLMDTLREDEPEICIVFSDMEFSNPYLGDINTDLIWIQKGNSEYAAKPSKGEVIQYD